MKTELFARTTSFENLPRGALFRYASGENQYLAIKVFSLSGERLESESEGRVVLDHPRMNGRPVLMGGTLAPDTPTLEITNVEFRASRVGADWALDQYAHWHTGELGIVGTLSFLSVTDSTGSQAFCIDVNTGQLSHPIPPVDAVVRRWTIVQIVDAKPEPVFSYPQRR